MHTEKRTVQASAKKKDRHWNSELTLVLLSYVIQFDHHFQDITRDWMNGSKFLKKLQRVTTLHRIRNSHQCPAEIVATSCDSWITRPAGGHNWSQPAASAFSMRFFAEREFQSLCPGLFGHFLPVF
jgi:hypothetical protein